jgi:hypothetical protein
MPLRHPRLPLSPQLLFQRVLTLRYSAAVRCKMKKKRISQPQMRLNRQTQVHELNSDVQ